MRSIDQGWMKQFAPSYEGLCINHYACQSRDFFVNFKQQSGAADVNQNLIRSEEWWQEYDRNDVHDRKILKYLPKIKIVLDTIQ